MPDIRPVASADDLRELITLFLEYARLPGAEMCFTSFDKELSGLPGPYSPPDGRLLLAWEDSQAAGCVALKPLEPGVCEMKRLYVLPAFRGRALGRALAERLNSEAVAAGYMTMRLETIPSIMKEAVALYGALGFRKIEPPGSEGAENGSVVMERPLD